MRKMPCLFEREFHGKQSFTLLETVTAGCEWVLAGEGVASRKRDGTACLIKEGVLFKRYDAKWDRRTNEWRRPPSGAVACDEPDAVTGHWPHWLQVDSTKPEDKWHVAAFDALPDPIEDGTYELCGPHFSANPEGFERETFVRHGAEIAAPLLGFDLLRTFLSENAWEGLVFAHPDGRFAKIRRKDFGLSWPVKVIA